MILQKLLEKNNLTKEEARNVMENMMDSSYEPVTVAALLVALRMKGESTEEIGEFAKVMRERAIKIEPKVETLVDTCGTGGDASHTFNISTTAAFIAAGVGVKIAKHGNRSVSNSCGSADVLEQLGVQMLHPKEVEKCIEKIGIGFMFAPYFHPAMKNVAPVRKVLGVKTVFNILGPLTNPAGAQAQLLGVYDFKLGPIMANVLSDLGTKRAMMVHSDGMDEMGLGKTKICELKNKNIEEYEMNGSEFGFEIGPIPKITSKEDGAKMMKEVLGGRDSPARDIAIMNAAGAIYVSGTANSMENAIALAEKAIDNKKAMKKLEELKNFGCENHEFTG